MFLKKILPIVFFATFVIGCEKGNESASGGGNASSVATTVNYAGTGSVTLEAVGVGTATADFDVAISEDGTDVTITISGVSKTTTLSGGTFTVSHSITQTVDGYNCTGTADIGGTVDSGVDVTGTVTGTGDCDGTVMNLGGSYSATKI